MDSSPHHGPGRGHRVDYLECVTNGARQPGGRDDTFLIGALDGEGIGAEVVGAALSVVAAAGEVSGTRFVIEPGGPIGREAERNCGRPLSTDVIDFCEDIFERGGAILAGAGGGRFVYDLRKQFDLFCKIVPIRSSPSVRPAGVGDFIARRSVDLVLVRENTGGIYQGTWESGFEDGKRFSGHAFRYTEDQVRRILEVGARIANRRSGKMSVVWKESGIPSVSELWRECAEDVAKEHEIGWSMIDVDYAAYWMLLEADRIDVIVAPNLFGDVLGDMCGILQGARGMTYSGNYSPDGSAVYQTNHGAAYVLAGTNTANPIGQIRSAAMMLRESFGLAREANLVELAVNEVLEDGWRTPEIAESADRTITTSDFADRVAEHVLRRKSLGVVS